MNRRSILRLLGVAPVAAPLAVAAAARSVSEAAPLTQTYGVSGIIDGQASDFSLLSTRVEALAVEVTRELHALEVSHPVFIDGPVTIAN